MKTQMRVQKILMLVSLVVSALVFVYALVFMTGGLADVYRYIDTEKEIDYINCTNFVSTSQSFVSTLVALGIVMIVLVAFMYLMACNSRRKYYATNYIAIGLFVAFALAVAIYLVVMVAKVMDLYQNDILWKSGEGGIVTWIIEKPDGTGYETLRLHTNYAEQARFFPDYPLDPNQTYNFILGFVLFVIVIADVVCVALCTVWKILLMNGEKKLLAAGVPATEVPEETAVADATALNIEGGAEDVESEAIPSTESLGDKPVEEEN